MKSKLIEKFNDLRSFQKETDEFLKDKKESDILYTKFESTIDSGSSYTRYRVFFIYKDENEILENKETI